jgi:Xaa-Pro aminopeptidase
LRGSDIEYNPLFFSYGILTKDFKNNTIKFILYSDKKKFQKQEIKNYLERNNIQLFSYDEFQTELEKMKENKNEIFLFSDKNSLNQRIFEFLSEFKNDNICFLNENPIENLKSIKNISEIESLKRANLTDGVCLIRFYSWLERNLIISSMDKSIKPPTEYDCSKKLIEFRKKGINYQGESFCAISSSGPNGAIIHYKPDKNNSLPVDINNIYLLDSGAQYL